jgi:hypothetical protein
MLRRVDPVRTGVSVERVAFIIMVTTIGELGTILAVTSYRMRLHLRMADDKHSLERFHYLSVFWRARR